MSRELIENDLHENPFAHRTRLADDAEFRFKRKLDRCLSWIRSCAVCGGSLPPISLLCRECWVRAESVRNRGEWLSQPGYPFKVYALFTWTEESAAFVKPLIYGFKRGLQVRACEKLTELFLHERAWGREQPAPVFAHPASSDGKFDHSRLLAREFSRAWGRLLYTLEWDKDSVGVSQKRLNVEARAERQFAEAVGEERWIEPRSPRVFVDDVVTSGATAMAAWQALGRPEGFEVWALVCRPKLATLRRF